MEKRNNGSGRMKEGFNNYVQNMSKKYNMPQETVLDVIEQMVQRKRKELNLQSREKTR